jgi:beta-glucosidase
LVLNNGRPLAIPWAADNIPAIVEAWQLGTQSGNAIAQVLYGDYNPSGLPMTFPRNVGQLPMYYNYKKYGKARDG